MPWKRRSLIVALSLGLALLLIGCPNNPTAEILSPKEDAILFVGEEVTFEARGRDPDSGIVKYKWDFGDESTETGRTSRHTYTQADKYSITLTVTDDKKATDTATLSLSVRTPVYKGGNELMVTLDALGCIEKVNAADLYWEGVEEDLYRETVTEAMVKALLREELRGESYSYEEIRREAREKARERVSQLRQRIKLESKNFVDRVRLEKVHCLGAIGLFVGLKTVKSDATLKTLRYEGRLQMLAGNAALQRVGAALQAMAAPVRVVKEDPIVRLVRERSGIPRYAMYKIPRVVIGNKVDGRIWSVEVVFNFLKIMEVEGLNGKQSHADYDYARSAIASALIENDEIWVPFGTKALPIRFKTWYGRTSPIPLPCTLAVLGMWAQLKALGDEYLSQALQDTARFRRVAQVSPIGDVVEQAIIVIHKLHMAGMSRAEILDRIRGDYYGAMISNEGVILDDLKELINMGARDFAWQIQDIGGMDVFTTAVARYLVDSVVFEEAEIKINCSFLEVGIDREETP